MGISDTNIGETSSADQEPSTEDWYQNPMTWARATLEPDSKGARATPIPKNYQGPITRARLKRLQETIESIKGTKSDLPARQTLKNLSIIRHKPDIEGARLHWRFAKENPTPIMATPKNDPTLSRNRLQSVIWMGDCWRHSLWPTPSQFCHPTPNPF